jgi:hypothetical protein
VKKEKTMKTLAKAALIGAMALAAVTSALAQDTVKATIPFAFNVGAKAMPAGPYEVRRSLSNSVVLRNLNTNDNVVALTMTDSSTVPARTALVFHQYGDSFFLAQISSPASLKLLTMSKLERQVAARTQELARNEGEARDVYVAAQAK